MMIRRNAKEERAEEEEYQNVLTTTSTCYLKTFEKMAES